jgi:glyoxylase-like metal-dependent hydrolase (beta-lactamase superfamily II)/rhodanese-related sulfurtransferase
MASAETDIHVSELLRKADAGEPFILLDVRNDDEFENWKIEALQPLRVIHVPYFDFIEDESAAVHQVPAGSRDVVVVCAKGGSSEMAAEILRATGVPARNLAGGMIAYGEYLDPVRIPDAFGIWQFNRRGKGCLSYVITSENQAAVVDPSRSVEVYASFLGRLGARCVRVLDTHVHADHVSGGRALASETGAVYDDLHGGETFELGGISIRAIATPGHTPESMCFLVADRYLLSGDTLFTAAIGRPDLGGHVQEWSAELYKTLHERLARLPDSIVVLPAHYSSVAEIDAGGLVAEPLGELRRNLPEFGLSDVVSFTQAMKSAVKTPPPEYAHIIDVNRGKSSADQNHIVEWELGKNQCAASTTATDSH